MLVSRLSETDHHPRATGRSAIRSLLAGVVGAALVLVVAPSEVTEAQAARVTICHATGNGSWRVITPDVNSIIRGHGHHSGDIIPSFTAEQGNRTIHFGGTGLGPIGPAGQTGAEILANGCRLPAAPTTASATTAPVTTGAPTTIAPPTPPSTDAPPTTATQVPIPIPTVTPTLVPPSVIAPPTTGPSPTLAPTPTSPSEPTPTVAPTPTPTAAPIPTPTPTPTAAPPEQPTPTVAPTPTPTAAPTTTPTAAPPEQPTPTVAPTPTPTAAPTPTPTAAPPVQPTPTPTAAPGAIPTPTSAPVAIDVQLVPMAECVDARADGTRVVWFGYDLEADGPVRAEWDDSNQLEPNGLPPRLFGPGIHVRVVSVETTDGIASWSLAGSVARSGPDTPTCDELATTPATEPETTQPETTQPETTEPETTEPGTTQPETTEPTTSTGDCPAGQRSVDGECVSVDEIQLSLVDNSIDCDGFGIAVFAALNDNEFELDGEGFSSELSPARLDGAQPELISSRRVETENGSMVSEIFAVRYVTAVSWTVTHHGISSTISAGATHARTDEACPLAVVETTGVDGSLRTPTPEIVPTTMPVTGADSTWRIGLAALTALLLGVGLILLTRRVDDDDGADGSPRLRSQT